MKAQLMAPELIVFTTWEYAQAEGISVSAASRQLSRLSMSKAVVRLTRGVWANASHPFFNPMACVLKLLDHERGYVSFISALHRHGIISQIPATVQVASTGHSRRLRTALATFEFFQVKPELFEAGVDWSDTPVPFLIASAEKALLDCCYLATRRGQRFARLPELDLDTGQINRRRLRALFNALPVPARIRSAMKQQLSVYGVPIE